MYSHLSFVLMLWAVDLSTYCYQQFNYQSTATCSSFINEMFIDNYPVICFLRSYAHIFGPLVFYSVVRFRSSVLDSYNQHVELTRMECWMIVFLSLWVNGWTPNNQTEMNTLTCEHPTIRRKWVERWQNIWQIWLY